MNSEITKEFGKVLNDWVQHIKKQIERHEADSIVNGDFHKMNQFCLGYLQCAKTADPDSAAVLKTQYEITRKHVLSLCCRNNGLDVLWKGF